MTDAPPIAAAERARSRAKLWMWIAVLGTPLCLLGIYGIVLQRAHGDYLWLGTSQVFRVRVGWNSRCQIDTYHRRPVARSESLGDWGSARVGWSSTDAMQPDLANEYVPFLCGVSLRGSSDYPGQSEARECFGWGDQATYGRARVLVERFPAGALDDYLFASTPEQAREAARRLAERFPDRSTPLYFWIGCLLREGDRDGADSLLRAREQVFANDATILGAIYLKGIRDALARDQVDGGGLPVYLYPFENLDSYGPWSSFEWPDDVAMDGLQLLQALEAEKAKGSPRVPPP